MGGIARRSVLKGASGASVLLMGAWPEVSSAEGRVPAGARIGAQVVDTRLGPVAGAPWADAPRLATDGDVTRLWYDHLDLAWRKPGGLIGGTTGEDVLFVLRTLAHDRGRKVLASAPAGQGAVHWVIG